MYSIGQFYVQSRLIAGSSRFVLAWDQVFLVGKKEAKSRRAKREERGTSPLLPPSPPHCRLLAILNEEPVYGLALWKEGMGGRGGKRQIPLGYNMLTFILILIVAKEKIIKHQFALLPKKWAFRQKFRQRDIIYLNGNNIGFRLARVADVKRGRGYLCIIWSLVKGLPSNSENKPLHRAKVVSKGLYVSISNEVDRRL